MHLDNVTDISMYRCAVTIFINHDNLFHSSFLNTNDNDPAITILRSVVLSEDTIFQIWWYFKNIWPVTFPTWHPTPWRMTISTISFIYDHIVTGNNFTLFKRYPNWWLTSTRRWFTTRGLLSARRILIPRWRTNNRTAPLSRGRIENRPPRRIDCTYIEKEVFNPTINRL